MTLLLDFCHHTEGYNLSQAEIRLDNALINDVSRLETVLVLDADKTLAAEDGGALFWERVSDLKQSKDYEYTLKSLFSSPLGYSYTAFR